MACIRIVTAPTRVHVLCLQYRGAPMMLGGVPRLRPLRLRVVVVRRLVCWCSLLSVLPTQF